MGPETHARPLTLKSRRHSQINPTINVIYDKVSSASRVDIRCSQIQSWRTDMVRWSIVAADTLYVGAYFYMFVHHGLEPAYLIIAVATSAHVMLRKYIK